MPRENSFSDSEGRSLTPDLEEQAHEEVFRRPPGLSVSSAVSPTYSTVRQNGQNGRSEAWPEGTGSPTTRIHAPHSTNPISSWAKPSPKDRFRMAVRKVIVLHRGMTYMSVGARGGRNEGERIGAEPGVDPRRVSAEMQYGEVQQQCAIEITDFSSLRKHVRRMKNADFVELMKDDIASQRPAWVRIRWINIGGVSWEVIKALSFRYELHPLSLEDIFHGVSHTRSKADYYQRHLFLRVLCHQLSENDMDDENLFIADLLRSSSPERMEKNMADDEKSLYEPPSLRLNSDNSQRGPRSYLLPFYRTDVKGSQSHLFRLIRNEHKKKDWFSQRSTQQLELDALKRGERVDVDVSPMFIFLFRDGTVISIHTKPNLDFTAPIAHRLRQTDTVLRHTPDPSILVYALLDLIVDRALQVVDAYHDKINKFERDILIQPQAKTIRHLHILSGDIILHKRTLDPIKTLVYGLRRYDADRSAAVLDATDPATPGVPVVGFMSPKSKIYLADVFDHMEYILASLDMFAGIAENLVNYSFNSASYDMNIVMRRLTLVTIIGLPLTLLTGYFGMNFVEMWSVHNNSDLFFWKVAIPVGVFTAVLALWHDIANLYYYVSKKILMKQAARAQKIKHL